MELVELPDSVSGTNGIVIGRPTADGTYRWRFPVGTRAEVDAREGDRMRLRLAPDLHAWVGADDTRPAPPAAAAPRSVVGDLRFQVRSDRIELDIPLSAALPLQVEEPDGRTLELTLFGAIGNTDRVAQGAGSRAVEEVRWAQLPGNRYRLTVTLSEPVWGFRTTYRPLEGDRAELVLEIRRMPPIDPLNPLVGRRIVIDPGHPGAGATGPSGYYEGHANLGIGLALERMLEDAGAQPILIRRDTLPMGLYERTAAAIEAGGELYISIHNNALPDGVRPFGQEGTSTYYYHPHSRHLATTVQEGMLDSMRLRDLGVYWGNLAVCRMAWMPSILTEGAFMMMPDHEAALKDPEFQARYARGVLDGIREFLAAALRASGASSAAAARSMTPDYRTAAGPTIHPGAWIAPTADVIGDVTLGPDSSVWHQCVLRGDIASIRIGAESNVQDLTMVHVDIDRPCHVGDRVGIGHRAIIHGCDIEDDCLIGMGAIVLSNAVIGTGSVIAAGRWFWKGRACRRTAWSQVCRGAWCGPWTTNSAAAPASRSTTIANLRRATGPAVGSVPEGAGGVAGGVATNRRSPPSIRNPVAVTKSGLDHHI